MRPDQLQRLQDLSEKLIDVVLEEADPDQWPGAGLPIAAMSKQDRGDRFWCKRNANATFALAQRVEELIGGHVGTFESDDDMEKTIQRREKEASELLARAMKKAKGVTGGKASTS
jgi:hypothetical protein